MDKFLPTEIAFYNEWVNFSTRNFPQLKEHKSNFNLFNNEQFKELFKNAPAIVLVVNHAEHKYEFFSENVKQMMGYDAQEFYEGNVAFGVSLIHPDHMNIFSNYVFPAMFNAFEEQKKSGKVKDLRISYNFKFRRKDGVYVWLSQNMSVLEVDKENNALLSLYFMTDINAMKKDDQIDFTVSLKGDNGYFNPLQILNFPDCVTIDLTSRELEILKLISLGKISQAIADELYISIHTVNTHRKNMLSKTGVKNINELLRLSIVKGII